MRGFGPAPAWSPSYPGRRRMPGCWPPGPWRRRWRNALQQRLDGASPGSGHRYDLGVSYSIGGEGIGIPGDNSVTRIRLIARGAWTLRAQDPTRTALTSGSSRAIDGLNILDQQ